MTSSHDIALLFNPPSEQFGKLVFIEAAVSLHWISR
jgi:hypothetical protein